ncbi:MAG TPA: menaquinone biosynthesis protein [Flavisolibacter sp.]|nr:menaquinone biosynthesis protein [Flavisolibacter sp.]
MKKIRIAAVDYLNTKPLLYGIKRNAVKMNIELVEAYPAKVAQMLLDGAVDVGLIPVAVIPDLNEPHIITDYCIGCDGAVASVCIFSEVPLQEVKRLFLDYQSRTSVLLAKILLKEYWKWDATLIDARGEEYINEIRGTAAGLIIGDRALEQRGNYKYVYDLGEAWKAHTNLPFVFAAWVSNKELPEQFIVDFNEANRLGLSDIPKVLEENQYKSFDLQSYYTQYISYNFNHSKKEGLQKFLSSLVDYLVIPQPFITSNP